MSRLTVGAVVAREGEKSSQEEAGVGEEVEEVAGVRMAEK